MRKTRGQRISAGVALATKCTVLGQYLNPDVMMMESAEDWYRRDGAELLRAPKNRRRQGNAVQQIATSAY